MSFFSQGFRPFFFAAASWSILAMVLWVASISDAVSGLGAVLPVDWHVMSLLIGYVSAVIAGFLLTAVPNWTGSRSVQGLPLSVLFVIWLAARLAFLVLPNGAVSGVLDLLFLFLLGLYLLRAVTRSGNRRNLIVVLLLTFYGTGVGLFHFADEVLGQRLTLSAVLLLISLIGGRVTPAFTRNWLRANGSSVQPAMFSGLDAMALAATAIALVWWSIGGDERTAAPLFLIASLLGFVRLARWRGWAVRGEALLLMLHVAYLWLPLGYLFLALAQWGVFFESAALHALTAGAIGSMTLAIMMRATLGHSGLPLTASASAKTLFACVTLGSLVRVLSPSGLGVYAISGGLWIAAFALFLIAFGPHFFKGRS